MFPGGKGGRCVGLTTLIPSLPNVMKSGTLNLLEPSGPTQAPNGIALPFVCTRNCELRRLLLAPDLCEHNCCVRRVVSVYVTFRRFLQPPASGGEGGGRRIVQNVRACFPYLTTRRHIPEGLDRNSISGVPATLCSRMFLPVL